MTHYTEIEAGLAGSGYTVPGASPQRLGLYRDFLKRSLDILVVLVAAPFVLPVVLLLGLLISRDGGSAFYCQDRIGRGGKVFRLWKLRSMVMRCRPQARGTTSPATRPPAPNGTSTRSSRTTRGSPRSAG